MPITANAYKLTERELNPTTPEFSLSAFREANKLRLYLKNGEGSDSLGTVFEAYFKGGFNYNLGINYNSLIESFKSFNAWVGPLTRAFIQPMLNISGSLDSRINPYIESTEPITMSLPCFLPIVDPKSGIVSFKDNILKPLSSLERVVLPMIDNGTISSIKDKAVEFTTKAIDYVFERDGDPTSFWSLANDAMKNVLNAFVADTYLLKNPEQFMPGKTLILRIGPWRFEDVMIKNIGVAFSPLLYTDGEGNTYPDNAKVTLEVQSRFKATVDGMSIQDRYCYSDLRPMLSSDGIGTTGGRSSNSASGGSEERISTQRPISNNDRRG